MTDLPAGKWSQLLVGHQWPDSTSLHAASQAAVSRGAIETAYLEYASTLRSVRDTALAQQHGITAENIQSAFDNGEQRSYYIAEKNASIRLAYESAYASVSELRSQLAEIAERGNMDIDAVEATTQPSHTKRAKVFEVILAKQAEATSTAATQCENVLNAVQSILQASGIATSARALAEARGVDLSSAFKSPDHDTIRSSISGLLDSSPPRDADVTNIPKNFDSLFSTTAAGNTTIGHPLRSVSPERTPSTELISRGGSISGVEMLRPTTGVLLEISTDAGSIGSPSIAVNSPFGTGAASPTSTAALNPGLSPRSVGSTLSQHLPSLIPPPNVSNPLPTVDSLLHPLNATMHPSAVNSPAVEPLSNPSLDTTKHHTPLQAAPLAAPTISSSTPIFETAHAAVPSADTLPMAHAQIVQPLATAAPAIQPSTISAAPTVSPSSLPGYGADVRPPVATPAPPPTPAMPTAAPTTPQSTGAHTPSAVVRQQPAEHQPPALPERAFAAASAGAMAAATATNAAATKRLKDLLAAVTCQEPKLRWAIGDISNGTTVLATDIAHGWIPPHIKIPNGLTLIQPQSTARSLDALLAGTTNRENYEPGQPVPAANCELPTSTRARETTQPDDPAWSLVQATKWRDGLPRLAHTLAKAATAKTGHLDSEVAMLHQHLARTAQEALVDYPATSPTTIENWQLLACIAALIDNERTCANYHLAWFEHSRARQNA